jgi:rod shape-determining protein MreC
LAVYRRSARRRSIVILLVITSITLITLDERGKGTGIIGSIRSGAHDVVAPVQRGVHDVTQPVTDWFDGITSRGQLEQDNRKLRHQVESLKNQVRKNEAAAQENPLLKHQLGLDFLGDIKTVAAQVISGTPGNFDTTIEIDKGTARGVAKGMPVVSDGGPVGRVVEVGKNSATVLLVSDPSSSVAVRIPKANNATGVASGQSGTNLLSVSFVNPDATVTKGMPVFTAGQQDGLYPAGIPVGTVSSVSKAAGANRYDIAVSPGVDLGRLQFVQVMQWTGPGGTP